ncbi:MAG TPA: TetR/AcrR family transcriptional regulator C-terminal ligand-binding domain-containing protein, partial [Blastococcus sp.]
SLVTCWTRPLDREERAVASIVGAARHEQQLRAGLDDALVRPLADAVTELGRRSDERGELIEPSRLALLGSVLQAFWWQRYTAAGDGAMAPGEVERVVDVVLVPIAAPASADLREPATV